MTFGYPWVIAGINEMPIDVARLLAYVGTGGVDGVVGKDDLKVLQTTTASSTVRIQTGAFITVSRFLNSQYESYIGRNSNSEVQITVPNAGSSATSQLVYLNITDPGQSGQPSTAQPVEALVIPCNAGVTRLQQVPGYENRSGLAIARIDRPANSTTVTQAQIIDLRIIANARSSQVVKINSIVSGSTELTSTSKITYPPGSSWVVPVPSWATRVQVFATLSGIKTYGTNSQEVTGTMSVEIGSVATADALYDEVINGPSGNLSQSFTISAAGEVGIPTGLRGTNQTVAVKMRRNTGPGRIFAQAGLNMTVMLTFIEVAGDA